MNVRRDGSHGGDTRTRCWIGREYAECLGRVETVVGNAGCLNIENVCRYGRVCEQWRCGDVLVSLGAAEIWEAVGRWMFGSSVRRPSSLSSGELFGTGYRGRTCRIGPLIEPLQVGKHWDEHDGFLHIVHCCSGLWCRLLSAQPN